MVLDTFIRDSEPSKTNFVKTGFFSNVFHAMLFFFWCAHGPTSRFAYTSCNLLILHSPPPKINGILDISIILGGLNQFLMHF